MKCCGICGSRDIPEAHSADRIYRAAEQYIDRIKANPEWGYIVRGILADNVPRGTEYKGIKVLGRIDNLMIVLPENKLDEIAITLGWQNIIN